MAANAYVATINVSNSEWRALAETSLVLSAWIRIWSAMGVTNPLSMRVGGGDPASVPNNSDFRLEGVDLSQVEVKGETGYRVTIVGSTR